MRCFCEIDDEPTFVLRARDKYFVPLVRLWIELVEMDATQPVSDAICAKLMEVGEIANRAVDWQNAHPEEVTSGGQIFEEGQSARPSQQVDDD